jgi:Obg family GTPase CgtA-like protein
VEGEKILRQLRMTDFENPEAVRHLQRVITKMGLLRALKRMGAKPGAAIYIGDMELEYHPE